MTSSNEITIDPDRKCRCGHAVKYHVLKLHRRMTNTWDSSECKLCNCNGISLE